MRKPINLRHTEDYLDALAVARQKGLEEGIAKALENGIKRHWRSVQHHQFLIIPKMAARKLSIKEIAEFLDLPVATVKLALKIDRRVQKMLKHSPPYKVVRLW